VRIDDILPPVRSTSVLPLVVTELMRNAVKAIGKETGSIRISARSEKEAVLLSVWNSGSPIPKDSKSFIFDFLYHRKRSSQSGFGFGLWWVRSILRAQGGDITLSDSVKSGTLFEITLRKGGSSDTQKRVNC